MRRNRYQSGYTLIEVLFTIAIIGILAAVAIPNYLSYRTKARAVELIDAHEEIRTAVMSVSEGTGSCADVVSAISPIFLQSKYAEVDVGFTSVGSGFAPFYRVCSEVATHGKVGIRVSKAAYNVFAGSGLISSGKGTILGQSMVVYSIPISGDSSVCTTYTPTATPGSGCGGAGGLKPALAPAIQVAATTSTSTSTTTTTTTTPPPAPTPTPIDYDKNIKVEDRTYRMCPPGLPPGLCEQITEEVVCGENEPFAMNVLHNNNDGSRTVNRKCATRKECYDKWYVDSSTKDKCMRFDPNNAITMNFDCSFCCTGKNCNAEIKPPKNKLMNWQNSQWGDNTNAVWEVEKRGYLW